MSNLSVFSEIGKLKTVLLHEPNEELDNLTPKYLQELLFDDIPWLPLAKKEHQAFADAFREAGVNVVYLSDLVSEALDTGKKIKEEFIDEFILEANIKSDSLSIIVKNYLFSKLCSGRKISETHHSPAIPTSVKMIRARGVPTPPESQETKSKAKSPMLPQFRAPITARISAIRSITFIMNR